MGTTVSRTIPIVQAGITLVSVTVYFEIDKEKCQIDYLSFDISGLNDLHIDLFNINTGVSVDANVFASSPNIKKCEDNRGCIKSVELTISVTKTVSVLGIAYRRAPYTVKAIFKSSCLPQCCK